MTKFCFLRVGNSSPASGLLVRRSRPGANIEAPPRFNPRSGRVGLFFYFFGFFRFLRGYGGRWSGAGRASVCGSARWGGFLFFGGVIFFFSFLVFISGQTANLIVGISYDRNFVGFVNVCVVI